MYLTDDDWLLKKRESESTANITSLRRTIGEKLAAANNQRMDKPPSYLYPLQKPAYIIPTTKSSKGTNDLYAESDTDVNDSPPTPPKEEEIKPKLVRPRNLDAHFKQILSEKQFDEKDMDEDQQFSNEERFFKNDSVNKYVNERSLEKKKLVTKPVFRTKSVPTPKDPIEDEIDDEYRYRYRASKPGHGSSEKVKKIRESFEGDDDFDYTENLTDKQKYHQSLMMKKQHSTHSMPREREYFDDGFRAKRTVTPPRQMKAPPVKPQRPYYEVDERTIDSKKHRNPKSKHYDDVDFDRPRYRDTDNNLPYRENVDAMIKAPRYKTYEGSECQDENCEEECFSDCEKDFPAYPPKYRGMYESNERQRYREKRISPEPSKESFHHQKEKFKQIDRQRPYDKEIERQPYPSMDKSNHLRRMPQPPPTHERFDVNSSHSNTRHGAAGRQMIDWSSDEEHFGRPQSPSNVRIIPREHYEKNPAARIGPSKSLGNLVKGYRHSYAEPPPPPRNPMPRNSGRVGLAAVNPY